MSLDGDKKTGLTRDLGPFHPDIKCCTFHPYLPSFTVGALLTEVKEGRLSSAVIKEYLRISRLDPLGAHSTRPATSICETGKHLKDRCQFFSKGKCAIHDFRPSTCAAYVCRSNFGTRGFTMWRKWEARLAEFEWSLAHEVAFDQGYTMDDIRNEFVTLSAAKSFYLKSYELAQEIDIKERFGLNDDL